MALVAAEFVPFIASSYFLLFGETFSSKPFDRFEEEVKVGIETAKQTGAVLPSGGLFADALRRQAQHAAALSGLPQKALLTGLGYCFLYDGWVPFAGTGVLIAVALAMQQRVDMHHERKVGPLRITQAGGVLLLLNAFGLVASAIGS